MAAYDRIDRISEEVRRALDKIIREDVRDPRVCGTFSIVRADVTRDLKFCTVRVSVLESNLRDGLITALKKAAGFIRRELGRRVQLRCVPELIFELDNNIEYAAKISEILKNSEGKAYGFAEQNDEN